MKPRQNNFTRGGQVALHTFRMTQQAVKAALKLSLWSVIFWMGIRVFQHFDGTDVYYGFWFLWGYTKLAIGGIFYGEEAITLTFYHLRAQSWKTWKALDFLGQFTQGNPGQHGHAYITWLTSSALGECTLVASLSFVLVVGYFVVSGRKAMKTHRKSSSAQRVSWKKLITLSQPTSGCLFLQSVALTQHTLITGSTGTGKTTVFHHLMPQISHEKMIIVDTNGVFIDRYFDAERDTLLNTLDDRSQSWTPWADAKHDYQFQALAESLCSHKKTHGDPFWERSAQKIISQAFLQTTSLQEFLHLLTTTDLASYAEAFRGTSVASLTDDNVDKTTLSIRSHIGHLIHPLSLLKDTENPFSLKHWLHDPHKQRLFLKVSSNFQGPCSSLSLP